MSFGSYQKIPSSGQMTNQLMGFRQTAKKDESSDQMRRERHAERRDQIRPAVRDMQNMQSRKLVLLIQVKVQGKLLQVSQSDLILVQSI